MTTKASINGAGTEKSLVLQHPIDNHYLDSIKIVSGVLGGLFAAALIITLIFYLLRYYKTARHHQMFDETDEEENQIEMENKLIVEQKFSKTPSVLLLYSYDCEKHFNVVKAFAVFLKEICKINVSFDCWEKEEISESSLESWIWEKVNNADFVIIIWSIGARMKLRNINKNYYSYFNSASEDEVSRFLFEKSMSLVNKLMKKLKTSDKTTTNCDGLNRYLNVYFPYSSKNDIAYQFDSLKTYQLFTDFNEFLMHIYENENIEAILDFLGLRVDDKMNVSVCANRYSAIKSKKNGVKLHVDTKNMFSKNVQVNESVIANLLKNSNEIELNFKRVYLEQFQKSILETKKYFRENPSWFENLILNEKSSECNAKLYSNSVVSLDSLRKTSTSSMSNKLQKSLRNLSICTSATEIQSTSSLESPNNASYSDSLYNPAQHDRCAFFMHPLPTNIDSDYFNMLEVKMNETKDNLKLFKSSLITSS